MLPEALRRLMREGDRRVQDEAGGSEAPAVDPDLPTRRLALDAFATLLLESSDGAVPSAVLAHPFAVPTLLTLTSSTDAALRKRSATLLRDLSCGEPSRIGHVAAAFNAAPDEEARGTMVSLLLGGVVNDEEGEDEVSASSAAVLLALRQVDTLGETLRKDIRTMEGALDALLEVKGSTKGDTERGWVLARLVEWLQEGACGDE